MRHPFLGIESSCSIGYEGNIQRLGRIVSLDFKRMYVALSIGQCSVHPVLFLRGGTERPLNEGS